MRRHLVPLVAAAVLTVSAPASAATPGVEPVKQDPDVLEAAPTSRGAWFGWLQGRRTMSASTDLYVQRHGEEPVRVNAPGTVAGRGGIAGRHVYFTQRGERRTRVVRYSLVTGDRSPLPEKVSHRRHVLTVRDGRGEEEVPVVSGVRGDVSASRTRLLFSGYTYRLDDHDRYDDVVLYDRATQRLRTVARSGYADGDLRAGQVNGDHATWSFFGVDGGAALYRYDIRTGATATLPQVPGVTQWDPGVSADGTVYYLQSPDDVSNDVPHTYELVRQPLEGPAEVVTTLTPPQPRMPPGETFVRDRPDGSRVVFLSWQDDVHKLVDVPPSGSTASP